MTRSETIKLLLSHNLVLIPLDNKKPIHAGWQQLTVSDDRALDPHSNTNIGVVLGNASGGVVDVDLDDTGALALADFFLPETGMEFGHQSNPRSHRIYRCENSRNTKKLQGPNDVIVELRGNGGQTMFPPSVHPSGECVEFSKAGKPSDADWNELEAAVTELAIATLMAPFYREGSRHDIAYSLSGFLRRCNWPQERTEQFIENLASVFQDDQFDDRIQCVRDAYEAANPMGRNKLSDLTNNEFVTYISKWTMYRTTTTSSTVMGLISLESEADCASEFVEEFREHIKFDDVAEQFYLRRHGVYVPVSADVIRGLVQDMPDSLADRFPQSSLKKFKSASGVRNIADLARPQLIADARSFDTDPMLLGVQNGVLHLKTETLSTSPSSIVTKRASVKFSPGANCPNFKAFLEHIMGGDKELIAYVRRVFGYCITGGTGEQACFIAIGSGANGKSTLFSVIHTVLGDYAEYTPMHTLMQTRFGDQNTYDLAALEGKRLVIAQEGEATSKLAEAKLKSMTGGDAISCRPIYGRPRTYDPRFKVILVTNDLPKIDGVDEAIWRRIKIIPFNVTIPRESRDPYLKEKLLKESDGILNFLVECFQEYDATGLSEPDIIVRAIRNYQAEADSVGIFIKARCDEGSGKSSSTKTLYEAYVEWCSEGGLEPLVKAQFGRNLGRKDYQKYRMSSGSGWKGIALKDEDVDTECIEFYQRGPQTSMSDPQST